MNKVIKIKDYLNKKQRHRIEKCQKDIDAQFNEAMTNGWCDQCNIVTSYLYQIDNGHWLCVDCLKTELSIRKIKKMRDIWSSLLD